MNETLTEKEYWEDYWAESNVQILDKPVVGSNKYSKGLYKPFRKFIKPIGSQRVLEIGGAPGLFVSSLSLLNSDLEVGILDYSEEGIEMSKRVFEKYEIQNKIHRKNLFEDDLSDFDKYDIAYSLGVVEHYKDIDKSINKHLECVKVGGYAIIGLPVFLGINDWLIKRFAPKNRATWYPWIMDKKNWKKFHNRSNFKVKMDQYVGGFNPHVHHRLESSVRWEKLLHAFLHKYFAKIWDRIPFTDSINSKYFSFYYYIVIQKISEPAN